MPDIIEDFATWLYSCFASPDPPDQPTLRGLNQASRNSTRVKVALMRLCRAERDGLSTGGDNLAQQALELLSFGDGKTFPHQMLGKWIRDRGHGAREDRNLYSPEHRAALMKIYERWVDTEKVENEFHALSFFYAYSDLPLRATREEQARVEPFLQEWIRKQKNK